MMTNGLDHRRGLFPGLLFAKIVNGFPGYRLGADSDDLLGGEIRPLDRAGKVDDQNRKIDGVEGLTPLHRRLLQRRVEALLFLVEQFSFRDVVDDHEPAVLTVENDRVRRHLHVNDLFVASLVTPGTGNHELISGGVFDYQRRDVFLRTKIVDSHRQELVAAVTVNTRRCFIDGEKPKRVFAVNPDRLRCRFKKQTITLFGIAQCFFKLFAFGDVPSDTTKTDGLIQAVPDRRNNQIQPTVLAGGGVSDKLMPKLPGFLRAAKTPREAIAFRNDAEN